MEGDVLGECIALADVGDCRHKGATQSLVRHQA